MFHYTFTLCLKVFSVTSSSQTTKKRGRKGKPSLLGLTTPSHTDLKWSPVIDQFQLCLEQTSPFIHVRWSLPFWPDCTGTVREIPPLWQDKMKEDGRAVRFLDRHSREPTLRMVMDCLYARLPSPRVPRAPHLHSKVTGAYSWRGQPRPTPLTVFGSPWWSRAARSEVISTELNTGRVERRKEKCSQGFRAWQGDRGCVVDTNVGEIPVMDQRNLIYMCKQVSIQTTSDLSFSNRFYCLNSCISQQNNSTFYSCNCCCHSLIQ